MTPNLKPLLLPQLVEEERRVRCEDAKPSHAVSSPTESSTMSTSSSSSSATTSPHQSPSLSSPQHQTFQNFHYPYPAAGISHTPSPMPQTSTHQLNDAFSSEPAHVFGVPNSSSSDIASPVTPTFSTRDHQRCASSASSLELPSNINSTSTSLSNTSPVIPTTTNTVAQLHTTPETCPLSPSTASGASTLPAHPANAKFGMRSLPDVQEEPPEPQDVEDDDTLVMTDHFGLYNCLCDAPCQHRSSSDDVLAGDFDYEVDYDFGFFSDGEYTSQSQKKHQHSLDSPFLGLTTRFGSRIGSLSNRWKNRRHPSNLTSLPITGMNFENVLSKGHTSRTSSLASTTTTSRQVTEHSSVPATPAMSLYSSTDSINDMRTEDVDYSKLRMMTGEGEASLEHERALATTPLLPPLMVNPFEKPPKSEAPSPLQSPTVACSVETEQLQQQQQQQQHPALHSSTSAGLSRPSLSSRPSMASLRGNQPKNDFALPLSALLQEHDSWSDRLGHANFTITPAPYHPEAINAESLDKFRDDWNLARVNYTKHIVRTGENYGSTSKIYGLTEAKWAELESTWSSIYDTIRQQAGNIEPPSHHHQQQQTLPPATRAARSRASTSLSRSRSRGQQPRSRSGSLSYSNHHHSVYSMGGHVGRASHDDYASRQWREVERDFSSIIPQMLAAHDADGKFPERGDEDIVGPMQRDAVMRRDGVDCSGPPGYEGRSGKLWKSLVSKVGIKTQS